MTKTTKIIITMALGIFLCLLDTTVMNIALPAIQTGLSTNLTQLSWALNSYTILFASLTIPLGRVADLIGRTKIYVLGLSLFLVGSLSSGLAGSVDWLIFGRSIQSIGAAIVFPASMTIGIQAVPLAKRTTAIAMLGVTQGLASAMGPTIGGAVTQWFGWRGIFLINVPLVVIALISCVWLLDWHDRRPDQLRLDWLGSGLSMVTLGSLTLALVKGSDWGWTSELILGLLGLSLLALIGFIVTEARVSQPMMPLALFKARQFNGAALMTVLSGIFLVALLVLMPSFFTKVQNASELMAALMITPASVMIFIFSPLSGVLLGKVGPRLVIAIGTIAIIGGYWQLTMMNPNVYWQVMLAAMLIGGGYGIIIGPITVLAAADFTGALLTASQSVIGVFRQIGTSLAVAIFVSALSTNLVTAKQHIWRAAQANVAELAISTQAKRDTLTQVKTQLATEKTPTQTTKTFITPAKTKRLIAENEASVLQQPQLVQAPAAIKAQARSQVRQKVTNSVALTNQRIYSAVLKIKHQTKRELTKAFIQPYQRALPFTFVMLLTIGLFDRRRDYLANSVSK